MSLPAHIIHSLITGATWGFRWDFNLNRSLIFYPDGKVGHQRGDGGIDIYTPGSSGRFIPPLGVYDILQKKADETYTLTKKDRTVYSFDIAGRLVSITDRNGNTLHRLLL